MLCTGNVSESWKLRPIKRELYTYKAFYNKVYSWFVEVLFLLHSHPKILLLAKKVYLLGHWSQLIFGIFVLMAQRLDQTSMSVLKCTSSPTSNPFVTHVKDILLAEQTLSQASFSLRIGFFVHFLGASRTPWIAFHIYWPLVSRYMMYWIWCET